MDVWGQMLSKMEPIRRKMSNSLAEREILISIRVFSIRACALCPFLSLSLFASQRSLTCFWLMSLVLWFFTVVSCHWQLLCKCLGQPWGFVLNSLCCHWLHPQLSKNLAVRNAAVPFVTGTHPINLDSENQSCGHFVADAMKVQLPLHPASSNAECWGKTENAVGNLPLPVVSNNLHLVPFLHHQYY